LYINNETLNNLFFKFFQIIIDQREIFGPIASMTFNIRKSKKMASTPKNHHHPLYIRNKVIELHNDGWTSDEIFKTTNVAIRTQRTYIKKNHDGVELIDKKRKNGMWNQGNSKVTEDYFNKLKSKLEHQNDLTAAELRSQLLLDTGIDITERRVQQILKDLGYTKKKKNTPL
jgi:transposase